ncbi:MAG: flagellar export protein FliJ [Enterovibrio sp.]
MSDETLSLLLDQAKQAEHKAQLALVVAQNQLQEHYRQVAQLENYRLEYVKQLTERGLQGLSASNYGHINRFVTHLDELLSKQRQAAEKFEQNVERSRASWQSSREKRHSLEWLLEKRRSEAQLIAAKREQRLHDEFACIAFNRRVKPDKR